MPTEELFGAYHFLLEIQGIINDNKVIVGGFKSVSGMDSETEIIDSNKVTIQSFVRSLVVQPMQTSYLSWLHSNRRLVAVEKEH